MASSDRHRAPGLVGQDDDPGGLDPLGWAVGSVDLVDQGVDRVSARGIERDDAGELGHASSFVVEVTWSLTRELPRSR
jgi:hypothetical protein